MDDLDKQQLHKFIEELKKEVREEISSTVNGKIDALSAKFDKHEVAMRPIQEAYEAATTFGKIVTWFAILFAGIGTIIVTIKGWING